MDELILFDRIHEALDVEPRPGAYDRLRAALARSPVQPRRGRAFSMQWPHLGLRLAAVTTVAIIAIAAAATLLSTRRVADNPAPADSDRTIAAYKLMLSDDYTTMATNAAGWACKSGGDFAACEADGSSIQPLAYQFLSDLNRVQTPARFAVAVDQLRRHVAAQISRTDALIAASRAHDAPGADRALAAIRGQTGMAWVQAMVASIADSRQGTVADYIASVLYAKQNLDRCVSCQELVGPNRFGCAGNERATCQELLSNAASQVRSFQVALVEVAAPTSILAKDRRLQLDLADADTALTAMVDALSRGDQSEFDVSRFSFLQAMAAVNVDAAGVLNG